MEDDYKKLKQELDELTVRLNVLEGKKVYQSDIAAGSITARSLNEQFILTSGDLSSSSSPLNNGGDVCWTITVSQENGAKTFTLADISLFVGSATTANQIGVGGSIDESQWVVIGPWHDWNATDNKNSKIRIYVRNVSAGAAQTVLIRVRVRYLTSLANASGS